MNFTSKFLPPIPPDNASFLSKLNPSKLVFESICVFAVPPSPVVFALIDKLGLANPIKPTAVSIPFPNPLRKSPNKLNACGWFAFCCGWFTFCCGWLKFCCDSDRRTCLSDCVRCGESCWNPIDPFAIASRCTDFFAKKIPSAVIIPGCLSSNDDSTTCGACGFCTTVNHNLSKIKQIF